MALEKKSVPQSLHGYLFEAVGTTATLCGYAAATLVLLVIFLIYILVKNDPEDYKRVPEYVGPENAEEK